MTLEQMEQKLDNLSKQNRLQQVLIGRLQDQVNDISQDIEMLATFRLWFKATMESRIDHMLDENRKRMDEDADLIQVLLWAFQVKDISDVYGREKPRWQKAQTAQQTFRKVF